MAWTFGLVLAAITRHAAAASLQKDTADVVRTEVQDRMSWWKGAHGQSASVIAPSNDRYLFFDYDQGGLNNIRIGWEMAAVAAVESNRTLVYPPSSPLYLLGAEPSGIEYFLNMDLVHSGSSVISIKQFIEREKDHYPIPSALLEYANSDEDTQLPSEEWKSFRANHMTDVGSEDEVVCDMETYKTEHKALFTSPLGGGRIFGCGNWPNVGEPNFHQHGYTGGKWETPDWSFALLRNHFVWHPDVFEVAGHVVQELGLFSYIAMHARYGDFQFQSGNNPKTAMLAPTGWLGDGDGQGAVVNHDPVVAVQGKAERVVAAMGSNGFLSSSLIEQHRAEVAEAAGIQQRAAASTQRGKRALSIIRTWLKKDGQRSIYIATDDTSKEYLKPFGEAGFNVVRWKELMEEGEQGRGPLASMIQKFSKARLENLSGPIEQLICTFGRIFVGSEKSTFTGYIERMRLYAQAPTHATFIKYAGLYASDKGVRMFHDDAVDPAVERKVMKGMREWEKKDRLHVVDRNDIGALPRDAC